VLPWLINNFNFISCNFLFLGDSVVISEKGPIRMDALKVKKSIVVFSSDVSQRKKLDKGFLLGWRSNFGA